MNKKVVIVILMITTFLVFGGCSEKNADVETVNQNEESKDISDQSEGNVEENEDANEPLNISAFLKESSREEIQERILCRGDIDKDGFEDFIITMTSDTQCRSFLISNVSGEYVNLGEINGEAYTGHNHLGTEILSLDGTNKKYIVEYIEHDSTLAPGYIIFDYIDNKVEQIYINYPSATAYGNRSLKDYDNDGVYDHVSIFTYEDFQNHRVIEIKDFLTEETKLELYYDNEKGEFIQPEKPEDVIRAYMEASCLWYGENMNMDMERRQLVVKEYLLNRQLKFMVNTVRANEIELDIVELDNNNDGEKLFRVSNPIYDTYDDYFFKLKLVDDTWKISEIRTEVETVVVNDEIEFLEALRSDRIIKLNPGEYDLNSIEETDFSGSIEELFSNLDNVVIEGVGEKQVDFITSAGYESVIKLQNCSNITIRNLNMGHAEALIDVCSGDVVEIVSCNNITIENSTLFGCGVKGLAIRYSNTVELIDSVIKECSEAIAYVELSSNIRFTNSVFKDNNGGINTNDVRDFVIEQCQIIGDDQLPELSDSTQYYYLTNEGMISDSYKGYLSAYIENQEDWISGVIVKNTFLSRKYVIDDHLALKKALEEKLTNQKMDIDVNRIRTNSDYRKLEISMNLQDRINQWSKEDICSYVYQFKKTEAVLEAFDFNEIVFKFRYEAKDRSLIDGLSVFMNKDMFIQYLSSENQTDIDKYGTIISSNEEIDFSEFLQTGAQFNTVDEAREDIKAKLVLVESISDLDERTIQIFENFGEDNFQFLEYQNAQIENQKLYYYFGVKQKEPLFGDFIHHSYFSNLKVDAMTGVVYEVDLITGEREVKEKNEEVKKTIMDYAKSIESEYMIDQKYSMFLTLDSSQGSRLVKVQFFSEDMGSRGYGIYTLEMSDGKWVVKDVVKGESLYDQSEYKILLEEYNKNVERERFKKENERKFQEVKSDGFHPILLSGGFDITGPNYVIGGLLDQGWCNDRKKLAEYFNGTETYKVYSFDESLGDWNGSKVIFDEETETYRIELKDEKGSEFSGQYMAVEGDWDALPRIPKRKDNIDEYKTAMIDIVRAQGIREQDLKIAEVIGVDLEGDGTEEIIVTAENYKLVSKSSYNYYRQYYVIAMFKIVDGKLESVVLEDDYGYSWNYDSNAVTHILDLDGDGKMEIVLKSMFQDDIGVDVLEINGLNIKKVLEYGFGAY